MEERGSRAYLNMRRRSALFNEVTVSIVHSRLVAKIFNFYLCFGRHATGVPAIVAERVTPLSDLLSDNNDDDLRGTDLCIDPHSEHLLIFDPRFTTQKHPPRGSIHDGHYLSDLISRVGGGDIDLSLENVGLGQSRARHPLGSPHNGVVRGLAFSRSNVIQDQLLQTPLRDQTLQLRILLLQLLQPSCLIHPQPCKTSIHGFKSHSVLQ
jgi:hypothetical protein